MAIDNPSHEIKQWLVSPFLLNRTQQALSATNIIK